MENSDRRKKMNDAFRDYCSTKYWEERPCIRRPHVEVALDWVPLLMDRSRVQEILGSAEFKTYVESRPWLYR